MSADRRPGDRARRAPAARKPAAVTASQRARAAISLGLLLAASTAAAPAEQERTEAAGEPARPPVEELFLGETAFPQEALELQVTSAPAWERAGRRVRFGIPLLLELGITDRLQVGGELPLELVRHDSGVAAGLGAVQAEVLVNLVNDQALGLALSAGLEAGLPAGARALGAPGYALSPFVSLDKAMGGVHVAFSASAEVRLPAAPRDAAELGLGVALGVVWPLGAVVPTVELAAELDDAASLLLASGVLWHPARGLELGAALELGLLGETPDAGLLLLVTREIELAGDGGDPLKHGSRSRSP
ncbi:hypothetical protein WME75_27505 [Sorangium sp. So ce1014]|uniref:hypothetical protein n=1 Tax=Sorangium sp. So ce1014 TaxID=3133326 RepID=UPI003F63C976